MARAVPEYQAEYGKELTKPRHFRELLELGSVATNKELMGATVLYALRGALVAPLEDEESYEEELVLWLLHRFQEKVRSHQASSHPLPGNDTGKPQLKAPPPQAAAPAASVALVTPARPAATRPAAAVAAKSDSPSDSLSDLELTPTTKVLVTTLKAMQKSAVKMEQRADTVLGMSVSQQKTIEHHAEADNRRAEADTERATADKHRAKTTENMSKTLMHANETTLVLTKQSSQQQIQLGELNAELEEKKKYIAELEKKQGSSVASDDENFNPTEDETDAVDSDSKPAAKTPGVKTSTKTATKTPGVKTAAKTAKTPGVKTAAKTSKTPGVKRSAAKLPKTTVEFWQVKPPPDVPVLYNGRLCKVTAYKAKMVEVTFDDDETTKNVHVTSLQKYTPDAQQQQHE